jgi:transglutaminase-like putative cysteine protease
VNPPVTYQVRHQTVYAYAGQVAHAQHLLHLLPRTTAWQACSDFQLELWPEPVLCRRETDAFGNGITRLEIDRPHTRLEVTSRMRVVLQPRPAPAPDAGLAWEQAARSLQYGAAPLGEVLLDAVRYRTRSPLVPIKRAFSEFASGCFAPGAPVLAGAIALRQRIHGELRYTPGDTEIATPLLEVLERRRGVCQDYAHLMIACLRSLGLAARYVSGYLRTQPGVATDRELVGSDASHAWVAVHAPPHGWVELDPTNDLIVNQDHVVLGWGRDFGDVSPLRGVILGGGAHSLEVGVSVKPLAA